MPIVAALSVKGGTGRTASAVGLAIKWSEQSSKPILLVDADLEAPGISYLFRAEAGDAKIALEDLIALAHSEDDPESSGTIEYAAERLRDHLLRRNVIVLPIRRDLDELASSSIRPEHLSTSDRPYALADMLSKVAGKLGCAGVVVDVRAGLVPIGVNMAMDPDVSPMIVTTLSDQALKATSAFVRFVSRELRIAGSEPKRPLIVVNRVPNLFKQAGMDLKLLEPFAADLLSSLVPEQGAELSASEGIFDETLGLEPYAQVQIPELPEMQVSSADWSNYVEQLASSGFLFGASASFNQWIEGDLSQPSLNEATSYVVTKPAAEISDRRERLAKFADSLISAENIKGVVSKPLVTTPLAALAQRFQSEVPIAVSEGAKGTGKTLAARYFIDQGDWEKIVSELVDRKGATSAFILPVCASIQSSGGYQDQVDNARQYISKTMGLAAPQTSSATTSWLKEQLTAARSEREWVDIWLDVTAWSAGFEPSQSGAGERFLQMLRDSGRTVVAVLEGLEELYTSPDEPGVRSAMRAALVSLPQRLRSELRRPLGAIAFARRDTVETAITQNLDQYRREYSPFALTWSDGDVLELAAWLATQAGALDNLWSPDFSSLPLEEKERKLETLWGRKLGPDDEPGRRIREAYTATWIIAVLSDLQGRLVPRDLIRLLANAAKSGISQEEKITYGKRLLVPRALKAAVATASEKKVTETEEEIKELRPIFIKFREHAETLAVPLEQAAIEQLGLNALELETLKRHGIVFGEAAPYEVPELFRRGLRLKHAGARRSVVNLYRRARQL
ncbi:ParA family protein [Rhizobium leguminosarum]|uniref:ParA family protein n=1 Tax=Rhizobium TaxID=379 RepID=UPI00102F57BE|nr:ParA family protein [Rhizobium leguminosarum]TAU84233.1 ParA family protein [Rhizobium leguminosarum]TAX10361.1 ParA family protein [Rhizobium leguminosarum]TAY13126.1 ParA family protein [Rhizobium leguminosarum]TAZ15028.1 ParA family protein [Rhizobium leguminosarum]